MTVFNGIHSQSRRCIDGVRYPSRVLCPKESSSLRLVFIITYLLAAIFCLGIHVTASADPRMNTNKAEVDNFSPGIAAPLAKEIWNKSISEPAGRFILLRSWDDEKEESKPAEAAQRSEHKILTPAQESEPEGKEVAMIDETRESIIERYGDPREQVVITPDQAAPKPFKGIHAALQIGDEQLAFDYARKHVRYMTQFEDRVGNLQGLIAKAMEAEGIADGEGWTAAPQFARFGKYVDKALEEQRRESEPVWDEFVLSLPAEHRLRAILPMSEATQYDVVREVEHREVFRRYFQKKAPSTPDGKVVLRLYVDVINNKDSLVLARELSELGQYSRNDEQIEFHLFSRKYVAPDELKMFQRRAGLIGVEASVFPVDQELPSGPFPLVTIELPALKKEYQFHGIRRSYFFEELIQVMSGRRFS
ncbi:hypothetical protein EBR25_10000 [bacterium]|nr:hypothetical protein [bacterium]